MNPTEPEPMTNGRRQDVLPTCAPSLGWYFYFSFLTFINSFVWQAERSDISAKPNAFKLLYAFEAHRHNWRRAASYIYRYSVRLRAEAAVKDHQLRSFTLQERLNGLATAINALQLVNPLCAWIEAPVDDNSPDRETYPNKKARITMQEQCTQNIQNLSYKHRSPNILKSLIIVI